VALLVNDKVVVTVLPPSLNVPEVSVKVAIEGSTFVEGSVVNVVLGNDDVSVPALLFTVTALRLVMEGLVALGLSPYAQVCEPVPLNVTVPAPGVKVAPLLIEKLPPMVTSKSLVTKVGAPATLAAVILYVAEFAPPNREPANVKTSPTT